MNGDMKKHGSSYGRFAAMIATSTIVMFGLMYLNSYALDHIYYSQTRTWMAVYMGAVMAIIMLGFMWSMYNNRRMNAIIVAASLIVFATSLWLVRSQQTVDDVSYMKAMIPHHSIAIMTSERAKIRDPRVRKLAEWISSGIRLPQTRGCCPITGSDRSSAKSSGPAANLASLARPDDAGTAG